MFGEEGGEAGQETVCQRLAVHLFEDNLLGEFVFGEELIAERFGELLLETVAHEAAA